MSNMSEFSISCWTKPTSSNLNNSLFLVRRDGSHQIRLSSDGFCFRDNHHSSQTVVSFGEPFLENIWTHISCVYKKGIIYLYQNGIQTNSANYYHEDSQTNSSNTEIRIGRQQFSSGNNYFTGYINDFRIYDHALSPMEVKQISQGLILHYPLNNNGFGQKNLLINSNIEKSGKSNVAQWFRWNITDSPLVTNQYYTLSFDAKITVPTDVFYIGLAQNDSTQEVLQQGVQVTSEYKRYIFTGKTTKTNINSIVISNCKRYGRGNNNNTTGTLYIKNIKLELGQKATPWCPNEADELYNILGLDDNIQYDTSGYNHNLKNFNKFSFSSDTPRYSVSTELVGTSYGTHQYLFLNDNYQKELTVSCWIKRTSSENVSRYISNSWIALYLYSDFAPRISWRNSTGTSDILNTWAPGGAIPINTWTHICFTIKDGIVEYYKNGTHISTSDRTQYGTLIHGSLSNGFGGESLTSKNWIGELSDFRFYCTAISAEDVFSLYHNSAYIDNQGNIYGAIYEEV